MGDTAEQTNTSAAKVEVASNTVTSTEVASGGNGAKVETPPVKAEPQYLTLEQARQLFREEADKKVSGIQRAKDLQISAAERRAAKAEAALKDLQETQGVDENTIAAVKYRVNGKVDSDFDAEDKQRALVSEMEQDFQNTITENLDNFGIDPKDKRIDWADDQPVSNAKLKKVLASIGKIHRDNLKKFREDTEAKVRKDSGVDEIIPASPSVSDKVKLENLSPAERVKERDRRLRENKK